MCRAYLRAEPFRLDDECSGAPPRCFRYALTLRIIFCAGESALAGAADASRLTRSTAASTSVRERVMGRVPLLTGRVLFPCCRRGELTGSRRKRATLSRRKCLLFAPASCLALGPPLTRARGPDH